MAKGLLIAVEGIDGAGTTTQLPFLAEHARRLGRSVHTTAEPSHGSIGKLLRGALRGDQDMGEAVLALLFAADRLDHLRREIVPHLQRGDVVITDRYLLSSYAYQSSQLPLAWVQTLNDQAQPPDATLFFRISPSAAARRRQLRGEGSEHFDEEARQEHIARLYEQALCLPTAGYCQVIDAEASVEQVTLALHGALQRIFARVS